MPSAFSVLAESPAARRRRRLARLQAQAEFEEIIARVDAEEQAAGDEAHLWAVSARAQHTAGRARRDLCFTNVSRLC